MNAIGHAPHNFGPFQPVSQQSKAKKTQKSNKTHDVPTQKPRGLVPQTNKHTKPIFSSQDYKQAPQQTQNFQRQRGRANTYINSNTNTHTQPNYVRNLKKFETQYNIAKFSQDSYKLTSSQDKSYRQAYASTASETESSGSQTSSELNGFKIVHAGAVIHDETEEELGPKECIPMDCRYDAIIRKYASSQMMAGPSAKEISLPTFA